METAVERKKKPRFHVPHAYTIMFVLMIVVAALTWIVPSGQFERETVDLGSGGVREVTVANSYTPVDKTFIDEAGEAVDLRQGLFDVLAAPFLGIVEAIDVIAFIFIVGGAIALINKTNAITAGLMRLTRKLKNRDILLIPVMMTLFSLGGTTFGMSEETLPFFLVFLPIILGMGYDSLTSFMIIFLGAQTGYLASTINPFNVLISQGIVGITGNPLLWLRLIAWVVCTVAAIVFVMLYARRVKKKPESSIVYQNDLVTRKGLSLDGSAENAEFTMRHKLVLVIFGLGMCLIVWGLVTQGWYMEEIAAVFFGMGLLCGIVGGLNEKEMAEEFVKGMSEFAYAAIIVGFARSILVLAENGMIIDTILNAMANALTGVSPVFYAVLLVLLLALLTILVPSSSGLAALTIPILGPLTIMMGFNPEGAITALVMAEALACFVVPTNGMLMATLSMCNIRYDQWLKASWRLLIPMTAFTLVFTIISCVIPG